MELNCKSKRISYIDTLRGCCIILMIMGHIGFSRYFDWYIHMFHMPIWFFISGYFYKDKDVTLNQIVRKKIKGLIIPYLIWGVIQYFLWFLIAKVDSENIFEPLKNLLWINTNKIMPIAGALWFLTCLFFAEIIFTILKKKIFNDKVLCVVVMAIAFFGNLYTTIFNERLPWAIDTSFVAVGMLYLGYIFKNSNTIVCKKLLNLPRKICFVLFIVNGGLCFINGYINMRTGMYGIIPLFWLNALVATVILWNFSKYLSQYENNSIVQKIVAGLQNIGKYSIIYLCLNQLFILIASLLVDTTPLKNVFWFIKSIFIFICAVSGLIISASFIKNTKIIKLFGY